MGHRMVYFSRSSIVQFIEMCIDIYFKELSVVVMILLQQYVRLIGLLPDQNQRASRAQVRNSARVLFGKEKPEQIDEATMILLTPVEDTIVNSWRLMRAYERAVERLPLNMRDNERDMAFGIFLDVCRVLVRNPTNMRIISLEGRKYDANYPVSTMNIDEFDTNEVLIVSEMLEPIILSSNGKPERYGRILIAAEEASAECTLG